MASRSPDDAELVARARRGDIDAYAELVRRYQDRALAAAYVILGDRQEAEDATQEAFTRAYRALSHFRPDGSFRAWLLRIVVNEARDLYAARQRRADTLSRASGRLDVPPATESAEATALGRRRREALLEALFTLPENDRLVITCRYFLDLSEADIAEMLGIARGTVKSRLARALARLEPILRDLGPLALAGPLVLVQPSTDLSRWVLAHLSSAAGAVAAEPPATGGLADIWKHLQHSAVTVGVAVVAVGASAAVLLAAARQPAPGTSQSASITVYGGDLTDTDRQHLEVYFGSGPPAQTQAISRQDLVTTLQAHGIAAAPSDQAISSVHLTCRAAGSGLEVQTDNITGIPATAYAGILLTAGLSDASVQVASPPDKPVTGEDAVVGALQAFPVCTTSGRADPQRVELAYRELTTVEHIAGSNADLHSASDLLLQMLHTVITGGSASDAAQQAGALDDAARAQVISLLQQVGTLDYGEYAHGYQVQQLGPDHVQLVPQPVA